MAQKRQLITLLTDFGTADYYVGAMKGAAISAYRRLEFVDITHDIPNYDIFAAAYASMRLRDVPAIHDASRSSRSRCRLPAPSDICDDRQLQLHRS